MKRQRLSTQCVALSVRRDSGVVLGAEKGLHAKRRTLDSKLFHAPAAACERYGQLA